METRIRGIFPRAGKYKGVDIFGYTTKGIPGLDVIGMGPLSKKLKEKIIYLSKIGQLKIPLRKYILCVDEIGTKELSIEEKVWLELPILILFLAVSEQIPIKKLDDCFCSGRIFPTGKLLNFVFSEEELNNWKKYSLYDYKYIGPSSFQSQSGLKALPLEDLVKHIPQLKCV